VQASRPEMSALSSRAGSVSAVIPTLNEAQNIGWVVGRLPECVDEVIVVDGRSTDGTIAAAMRARPDARIVREPAPGKGVALRAGFAHAQGDIIVMLDADGSMEPAEIVRYVAMLEAGYDLVKGSRFLPGGGTTDISRIRSFGNLALLVLANRIYGCAFTELCYGFMAFRRSVLGRLALTADGFEIEAQIVARAMRAGLSIAEVPSFEAVRRSGTSNLRTFRDGTRVLRGLVTERMYPWPPREPDARGRHPAYPRRRQRAALVTGSSLVARPSPGPRPELELESTAEWRSAPRS
jgi:glycosyltransferase involved in cell wall biosynthesis